MADTVANIADFIWGRWTIALLVLLGLIMTVRSRGIQFRNFRTATRLILQGALRRDQAAEVPGDITPFQALTTAMAATIGNGNIAGVATAIAVAGPGAAFWMVAMVPFSMATNFAETFLAVKYRRKSEDGTLSGGPMLYLDKAAGLRGLGLLYAFCAALGAIGGGNLGQANSIALVMFTEFGIEKWITGILLAVVVGTVIIGGIKRIGQVAEKLVPTMVLLYVSGVVFILTINFQVLPEAFSLIISSAFSPVAVVGGFAGASVARALEYGIRRSVISCEAGLGTAGIAHSAAKTSDPKRQATIAMMGIFVDTAIVCPATALVVVITGVWSSGEISSAMVASGFNAEIPFGGVIVAISSLLFGFTTLVAWAYYGEQSLKYVVRRFNFRISYRLGWCVLAFFGSIYGVKPIWDFSDILLGLMVLPNVIGLLLLSGELKNTIKSSLDLRVVDLSDRAQ